MITDPGITRQISSLLHDISTQIDDGFERVLLQRLEPKIDFADSMKHSMAVNRVRLELIGTALHVKTGFINSLPPRHGFLRARDSKVFMKPALSLLFLGFLGFVAAAFIDSLR